MTNEGPRRPRRIQRSFAALLVAAALWPNSLTAQEPQALFADVPTALAAMHPAQSATLAALQAEATTKRVRTVSLNQQLLDQAAGATMNVFPGVSIPLGQATTERRGPSAFTWLGRSTEAGQTAVLVVRQNSVIGTIRSGKEIYYVRPLGGGLHAIVDVDERAFPRDEHPPEQSTIEQEYDRRRPSLDARPQADELQDEGGVLTVLVAYTGAVRTALGSAAAAEGLVQVAVDETNQSYANSGVNVSLQLVHTYETAYVESGNMVTDRNRFRDAGDGFMDEVHDLRNQHNADLAVLVTSGGGFCGIASAILAEEDTAFAVVAHTCATGYYSFGHEIGHLLGARHNTQADASTTPFAYGHGFYHAPANWRTVMSYNCPGGCTRLPYWSDPMVSIDGQPTGTEATNNNARVLAETAATIAAFRRSVASADRVGYVWANNPTVGAYTPSTAYSYNSSGGSITINRGGPGQYAVRFFGLGGHGSWGGNVQVTAYGGRTATPNTCSLLNWSSGGADFIVNVRCFTPAGTAADTRYTALVNWPR